ncbi:exopolysaccharide biosynthesis polyprenyl glycosylphosphotransferase [Sphingomonas adhaesiva]|uniref:exopolysaccharide biosynthesis polyprenyl glycosylphosphotransferase n=1 Tax=Sphingomonas adhaesiva TaxID=28212 RepID=UPI0020D238C9|nr:exopolysaccharide biosynthesis polyprenyl glycosylphosphotransferase [Sphingomonas adhaesiva]
MNVQIHQRGTPHAAASEAYVSVGNREQARVRSYVALAFCDALVVVVSFLVANGIYLGDAMAVHGTTMAWVAVPVYLWMAAASGAYSGAVLRSPRTGASKAVRALVCACAAMLIIAYSFKVGAAFSRVIFWIGTLIAISFLFFQRLAMGRLILRILGGTPISTVVIVDGIDWTENEADVVLDAVQMGFDPATEDPFQYHHLAKMIACADRVVIACRDERIVAWAHVLKCMAVDGEILAPEVDRIGMIGVGRHHDRRTLVVSAGPLHLRDRTVKRMFDIVVSALALVLLSPLMIAVAIAIRLESPGPVLFLQQRIGRDNTLFMMLKFRSMYHHQSDPSASVLTARHGDSRVTRVGAFIRRNSIDELPQLLNVLKGDMSIVGPRPHALSAKAADQLYWEIDERYRHRHAVKPGVTGLAQIRGYRGATVSASDLTNRLSSDLEYLRDWSMGKDLWILFRTVAVLRHDNAF